MQAGGNDGDLTSSSPGVSDCADLRLLGWVQYPRLKSALAWEGPKAAHGEEPAVTSAL